MMVLNHDLNGFEPRFLKSWFHSSNSQILRTLNHSFNGSKPVLMSLKYDLSDFEALFPMVQSHGIDGSES